MRIDDIPFMISLLDGLLERLCVDTDRIYATGIGSGGGLVHLLACNPTLSSRISASALINPKLYSGIIARQGVKDEVALMWGKCKPARIPMRLLEIHSENNTLNNYWAKSKSPRPLMPVVQWLVEWAHRNECGQGTAQPSRVEGREAFYVTPLEGGSIHEGFIHMGKLQQAYYTCYERNEEEMVDSVMKSFLVVDPNENSTDTSGKDNAGDDTETGTRKAAGYDAEEELRKVELNKDRGVRCLQHFFVKNNKHGWPRVLMKDGATEDISLPDVTVAEDDLVFDSTVEVLKFFDAHKLSDEHRNPDEKAYKAKMPDLSADALNEISQSLRRKGNALEEDADAGTTGETEVEEEASGKSTDAEDVVSETAGESLEEEETARKTEKDKDEL